MHIKITRLTCSKIGALHPLFSDDTTTRNHNFCKLRLKMQFLRKVFRNTVAWQHECNPNDNFLLHLQNLCCSIWLARKRISFKHKLIVCNYVSFDTVKCLKNHLHLSLIMQALMMHLSEDIRIQWTVLLTTFSFNQAFVLKWFLARIFSCFIACHVKNHCRNSETQRELIPIIAKTLCMSTMTGKRTLLKWNKI